MAPIVSVAQIRPEKADYAANLSLVAKAMRAARTQDPAVDILVFPETVMSGYFLEGGVGDAAVTAGRLFDDLNAAYADIDTTALDVVVGFYEAFQGHHHNSALYATLGGEEAGVKHVHRKVFLPTYGVFDESRFIQPGDDVRAFTTRFGRAAMIICEDAWHSIMGTMAALDGATSLFIPSASPARGMTPASLVGLDPDEPAVPASIERWERLARTIAGEHGIYVTMAQLVGFEGGKGFPGVSVIVSPDGTPLARGPLFKEGTITADCGREAVTRARTAMPLLSDLRTRMPRFLEGMREGVSEPAGPVEYDPAHAEGVGQKVRKPDKDALAIDGELACRWLEAFIKDEVVTRRGFSKGIVGLSGGVDSSLTAFLAARALGPENVIGVRMPYATSSQESLDHAQAVADAAGIELLTVDITAAVDGYVSAVEEKPDPTRLGNVMARTRMITLFDLSAARKALPLGTGNKTERLLGYFTWHADDSPPVNPLGDLFKTQVWELARYVGVPDEIVTKPATADLIEGQTDEGDLGVSYPEADIILHYLLSGFAPEDIERFGLAPESIAIVNRRLSATHWKRRLPTVAMVSQTAIGEYYLRPVDY